MSKVRAFRPVAIELESRVVLDHGMSGKAAVIHALAVHGRRAKSAEIAAPIRPKTSAGRVRADFQSFRVDFAAQRTRFLEAYMPIETPQSISIDAARADATAKNTAALNARSATDNKLAEAASAETSRISAKLDFDNANAAADSARKVADDLSTQLPDLVSAVNSKKMALDAATATQATAKSDSDFKAMTATVSENAAAAKRTQATSAQTTLIANTLAADKAKAAYDDALRKQAQADAASASDPASAEKRQAAIAAALEAANRKAEADASESTRAVSAADFAKKSTEATAAETLAASKRMEADDASLALLGATKATDSAKAAYDVAAENLNAALKRIGDADTKQAIATSKSDTFKNAEAKASVTKDDAARLLAIAILRRSEATAAEDLVRKLSDSAVQSSKNELAISSFKSFIMTRTDQLSQALGGSLLALVAAPGSKGKSGSPATKPGALSAYLITRITDVREVIPAGERRNVSLKRELILALPGAKANAAALQQATAAQDAAITAAENAILNGASLLRFNRSGGSSSH